MSGPGVSTFHGSSLTDSGITVGGPGAGVIGTAPRGRAFVPISVADLQSFITSFGPILGKSFGQVAASMWLQHSEGCTYTRLLGIGDGKKRIISDTTKADGENLPAGAVKNAGFVVGSRMTGSVNGFLGNNPYATEGSILGRTYLLGAFMSESNGSRVFTDAGIQSSVAFAKATWTPVDTDPASYISGLLTITDYRNTEKTYFFCSGDNGGTLTGSPATGDDAGDFGGAAGRICVQLGSLTKPVHNYVNYLHQAIDSTLGHNAGTDNKSITLTDNVSHLTLEQNGTGPAHNRSLSRDIVTSDSVYTMSGFSGGVPIYATGRWTPVDTNPASYRAGNLTIQDYRGVNKTYFFCDGDNGGTLTGSPTTGDNAGDYGGAANLVCVQLGTLTKPVYNYVDYLQLAIDSALGHNAGVANQNITLFDDITHLTLKQNGYGPTGNRGITRSVITSDSVYTISSFDGGRGGSEPIIRGILFAASGVLPALSGCYTGNASTASIQATGIFQPGQDGGSSVGSIDLYAGLETFTLLLNGHKSTLDYPSEIVASLNPTYAVDDPETGELEIVSNSQYISNVLNTDPKKIQLAGHYLCAHYDINRAEAFVTGTGIVTPARETNSGLASPASFKYQESIFLLTSSVGRNVPDSAGSLAVPNFENFSDRYQVATSPWVFSQTVENRKYNLFRFHALSDGAAANYEIKITVSNLVPGETVDDYGTFTVTVRTFDNRDEDFGAIIGTEEWSGCNLDPSSDNYIERLIGNKNFYYDFDREPSRQKFVDDGNYENKSYFIRIETDEQVKNQTIPIRLLPAGYRGPPHLVTSGSSIMSMPPHPVIYSAEKETDVGTVLHSSSSWAHRLVQLPIPYRYQLGDNPDITDPTGQLFTSENFNWGLKTTQVRYLKKPNETWAINEGIKYYSKYFPNFTTARQPMLVKDNTDAPDSGGTIYDCDRFNNNIFTLENILVHTASDADIVDHNEWAYAKYRRDRKKIPLFKSNLTTAGINGVRFFDFEKDLSKTIDNIHASFTFAFQGGFDGSEIFWQDAEMFTNLAAYFDVNDPSKDGDNSSVMSAYIKCLKILSEKSEVEMKVMALPGMRVERLTTKALSVAEERFDAFYVMDPEIVDSLGQVVTGSEQESDLTQTADRFRSRALGSSFGAAYFPDVIAYAPVSYAGDQWSGDIVYTVDQFVFPPSAHILGLYSYLDNAGSFFAPAGMVRGGLGNITGAINIDYAIEQTQQSSLEKLFECGLNPIITTDEGPVVFGQRTFLTEAESMMQRVSVRRMLLEIRRLVRETAKQSMLFQPATWNKNDVNKTLASFQLECKPILQMYLEAGAISRYKVQVDTTTTSQADIEANIVRGKIFLQPTKSDEIIELDFST